jgi:hypothetical protein
MFHAAEASQGELDEVMAFALQVRDRPNTTPTSARMA